MEFQQTNDNIAARLALAWFGRSPSMGDHLGARLACRLMVSTLNAKGGRLKYSCKLCFRDPTPEMTAGYEFPLDKCDVVDRRNLARFRQKRSEWANVLNGDEY